MTARNSPEVPPAVARPDLRLARQLSAAVVLATVLVIFGWYTGVAQLTTVVPGFVPMRPNTALCLLLLSLVPWVGPRHRVPAVATAAVVLAVAAVTAVEMAVRARWWVDRLLPGLDLRGADPQMAPVTAVCLILLAVSVIAAPLGRGRLRQAPALLALLVGYIALVGYLYGASKLYGLGAYSNIALPTAAAIALLGTAQLVLVPGGVLPTLLRDRGPAGRMVRSLGPFLLAGPPVLGFLRLTGQSWGWYDTAFGVALLVTTLTVTSLLLLVRTAQQVRISARATDDATAELASLNSDLERRVQEQTAEAYRLSAQFRAAFTASPISSALTAPDGRIELANGELLALVACSCEELLGRHVQQLFDDEHAATERELFEALLSGVGGSYQMERRLRSVDGEFRWVLVHVTAVMAGAEGRTLLYQFQDVTRRKAAEEQAEFLSLHDSLTELPNRTLLMDRLQQALHQAVRTERGVGVLFLDLDRFKTVNDTLGHAAGDQVLCEVGRRLQQACRAGDTVARMGGDEFVVVCPEVVGQQDLIQIASTAQGLLARPFLIGDREVPLGASIGVAFGLGHDDPDSLISKADQAMYRAKEGGRAGGYRMFPQGRRSPRPPELDVVARAPVERDATAALSPAVLGPSSVWPPVATGT